MTEDDTWATLKRFTEARIGLGRSGSALPTNEVLKFALAHARARDAVTAPTNWEVVEAGIEALGLRTHKIESSAETRDTYLRRPDLGRTLSNRSRASFETEPGDNADLVIMAGDGLSSTGLTANAVPLIRALMPYIQKNSWRLAPILLASQARVALADEAGEILGAKAALVLIGERPGLSSPDSLGAYLTYEPKRGRSDAERNCVSNIRLGGLSYEEGAFKIAWLLGQALKFRMTGVALKDESDQAVIGSVSVPRLGM
ncbi:MAG: ethanolamine ammonia-lyase subunit EutC [Hyphomicrobium sp.]